MPELQNGFYHQRRAASIVGYALLLGLIAVLAIAALQGVGENVSSLFGTVATQMGAEEDPAMAANLVAAQDSVTGMDVIGPDMPSYSAPVTLVFSNQGQSATGNLNADIGAGLDVLSDTCSGIALAGGEDCQIELRFSASTNGLLSAMVTVTDGTVSASTSLSGEASAFPPPGNGWGWGSAGSGRLGAGESVSGDFPEPILISGSHNWAQVSTNVSHSCGVDTDGGGWCWGAAGNGKLGNGTTSGIESSPVPVVDEHVWSRISAGNSHSCGLDTGGAVWCWGSASDGRIGDGSTSGNVLTPTEVGHVLGWTGLDVGHSHSCAIDSNQTAWCWGGNGFAQLGNGTEDDSPEPSLVLGGHSWSRISAGNSHSCGVDTNQAGWCWGTANVGRLGIGINTSAKFSSPQPVADNHLWADIRAGAAHSCGLDTDGDLWCWGSASSGVLGNGDTSTNQISPVPVSGEQSWVFFDAGDAHNCAINVAGEIWCWGWNENGQLGMGTVGGLFSTPQLVEHAQGWLAVSGGIWNTLAIAQD